jgi:hypothetical protein
MESAKRNITLVIDTYAREYPDEFELVKKAVQMKRAMMKDDKFGTIEYTGMRALFELPERVHALFVTNLTPVQLEWFKSKEGGRWFAKKFPVFSLTTV